MKLVSLLWLIFGVCLGGAVVAGALREWSGGDQHYVHPYQGMSIALGLVAAASLVMACLESRRRVG